MYLFAWIMIAAAVIAIVYFISRQSKDPGVNVFPLNFVHELPLNASQQESKIEESINPEAH